jgi:hypothetical protein
MIAGNQLDGRLHDARHQAWEQLEVRRAIARTKGDPYIAAGDEPAQQYHIIEQTDVEAVEIPLDPDEEPVAPKKPRARKPKASPKTSEKAPPDDLSSQRGKKVRGLPPKAPRAKRGGKATK